MLGGGGGIKIKDIDRIRNVTFFSSEIIENKRVNLDEVGYSAMRMAIDQPTKEIQAKRP